MSQHRSVWDTYVEVLNAKTREEKTERIARCARTDISYSDPMVSLAGSDALVGYMLSLFEMNPGGTFVTTSFIEHHRRSLSGWEVRDGAGTRVGEGSSYAEYDAEGRVATVSVFFST